MQMEQKKTIPWYSGEHQDALFYLLIAIFILELAIGGIAFFYGIIHAVPEYEGGPPVARFPMLAWAAAAILTPVALLLIVHLTGSWLSGYLKGENLQNKKADISDADIPKSLKRFYASVQHAPVIVLFMAILFLGGALFFVDGAFSALTKFGNALVPYIPWIVISFSALLAFCFLIHAIMVYRQRKMENEYIWKREVLEKTGLVLIDKQNTALAGENIQGEPRALPVLDIKALPEIDKEDSDEK